MSELACLIEVKHSIGQTRIDLEVYEAGTGRLLKSERVESTHARILELIDRVVFPLEVTAVTIRLVLRECFGVIENLGERIVIK